MECDRVYFIVFFLLDRLPWQVLRDQPTLLFTHSWKKNNWIQRFPKLFVLYEMQIALSMIWTRVVLSIVLHNNHYYTHTHTYIYIYILSLSLSLCFRVCVQIYKPIHTFGSEIFEGKINLQNMYAAMSKSDYSENFKIAPVQKGSGSSPIFKYDSDVTFRAINSIRATLLIKS